MVPLAALIASAPQDWLSAFVCVYLLQTPPLPFCKSNLVWCVPTPTSENIHVQGRRLRNREHRGELAGLLKVKIYKRIYTSHFRESSSDPTLDFPSIPQTRMHPSLKEAYFTHTLFNHSQFGAAVFLKGKRWKKSKKRIFLLSDNIQHSKKTGQMKMDKQRTQKRA